MISCEGQSMNLRVMEATLSPEEEDDIDIIGMADEENTVKSLKPCTSFSTELEKEKKYATHQSLGEANQTCEMGEDEMNGQCELIKTGEERTRDDSQMHDNALCNDDIKTKYTVEMGNTICLDRCIMETQSIKQFIVNKSISDVERMDSNSKLCNVGQMKSALIPNTTDIENSEEDKKCIMTTVSASTVASNVLNIHGESHREEAYYGEESQENIFKTIDFGLSLADDDDHEFDPYNRFFFESDHLALKDNKHYHLLLQALIALEGQRIQAIKDLDILCEEEAKALDDPIGFVEKLQNNEPLMLPERQRVIKLPPIPWDDYASSLGPVEKTALSSYHHTRGATQSVEKAAFSAVQSCEAPSTSSTIKVPVTESTNTSAFGDSFWTERDSRQVHRESGATTFSEDSKSPFMRSGLFDSSKPVTFNLPWSKEEQGRLEKLLQLYPQEEVEAKRWEKIAKALENRTTKQVASRVQKYFIKLTKAGLPVPGRIPNIPKPGSRSKRSTHYHMMGFRTSTFFPSYQPRVYMDEERDEDDLSSIAYSDEMAYISDDESISPELRHTREYKELMELKGMKRQKLYHSHQNEETPLAHDGFMCDSCGVNPITGTRWHCQDCAQDTSVDYCSSCMERGMAESTHSPTHRVEPISRNPSYYVDGDYVSMGGSTTGYNYLDPNFLPAAS